VTSDQSVPADTAVADVPVPGAPRKRGWGWLVIIIIAVALVGAGAGTLLVTNAIASNRYSDRIAAGDYVAWLAVERFGDDYAVPVLAGTSLATLRQGVGWYDGTAAPGQFGNCVLAGHRLGWGQPFAGLNRMQAGDKITLTTKNGQYHYTVITGPTVVRASQTDILAAVPGDATRAPTKALLTLTTAGSLLPSPNRLVVVAELS